MRKTALIASLLLLVLACSGSENTAKPLSEKGEKLYTLKGKILSRDASDNSLRIDHEAIPGFMEAMTMDYPVRGAKVAQLPPDHVKIEARLHINDDKYWITDVKRIP
jgi:protein SCO1/2